MSEIEAPTREELEREREEIESQRHAQRVKHNKLTGGGEVREGELQDQIDEHNRRLTETEGTEARQEELQEELDEHNQKSENDEQQSENDERNQQ